MNHNGQLNEILAEMENNYSTAKICPYQPELEYIDDDPIQNEQCNLALEPGRSFNFTVNSRSNHNSYSHNLVI